MSAALAELLVSQRRVPHERMSEALRAQALAGGALDTALLELGALPEAQLLEALGHASQLSPIHLAEFEPNAAAASFLAPELAERLGVVPLSVDGGALHVACVYPVAPEKLAELAARAGKQVVPWIAVEARVRDWLCLLYGLALPVRMATLLAALDPGRPLPAPAPGPLVEERTLEEGLLGNGPAPFLLDVRKPKRPTTTEPVEPEWTLEQARAALKAATQDREAVKDVLLRYARRTFDYVAAFAVIRGAAVGWDARGEGADGARLAQVSIPLDSASVFRTAALTRASYVGPPPSDGLSREFLARFGRAPRTVFLFPVELKSRIVAVLYGDSGQKPISQRRMADLLLFCQELPAAFAELILARKQREANAEAPPADVMDTGPRPTVSLGWNPSSERKLSGLGRATSVRPVSLFGGAAPLPDFTAVLQSLLGPDAAQRARAMAELTRAPEIAARILAASFPGPTAWSRLPVVELPEADELGPISAGLVRLGRPAAQALAPLLDSSDADVRYFALLTAGSLPFGELVAGILRGLFDIEPDISSAARAAATAFVQVPRFANAMAGLRQELAAMDPLRRTLAARALGELKDREAVEGLIGLTGSVDALCADAASEALTRITLATHGTDARAWTAWLEENRLKRRSEWLVAALRHPGVARRSAAIEELSEALGDTLAYLPEASAETRERAVLRWEMALVEDPRLRSLD